ncbi:MAG: glycosyltransferase family 4 protein [Chloroflexi bacterium]|nr:glycosyltransferase family 4 protein [Chloroflexota bacterium]
MKLVLIAQAPTPYLTPILNELADRADLQVIFMSGRRPARSLESWATFRDPWGVKPRFDFTFHPSLAVGWIRHDFHVQLSAGVSIRLARSRPDVVVIHGWGPLMVEPLLWRLIARRRAVMWTESTLDSGLLRGTVSDRFRRAMLRGVDLVVSNGSRATQYALALGVAPERVITSCLPSVPAAPAPQTVPSRSDRDRLHFLFVGRLVPRKRPLDVLTAFREAGDALGDATLTIIGDGPLRGDVEAAAADLGDRVRLSPRLEGPPLAAEFAAADVLVVPSEREVWGLVVNEALAAGLYVIATDQVASAVDLLRPGVGAIVLTGDVSSLVAAMRAAIRDVDRSDAGRVGRAQTVRDCTPRAFASALVEAAARALTT